MMESGELLSSPLLTILLLFFKPYNVSRSCELLRFSNSQQKKLSRHYKNFKRTKWNALRAYQLWIKFRDKKDLTVQSLVFPK